LGQTLATTLSATDFQEGVGIADLCRPQLLRVARADPLNLFNFHIRHFILLSFFEPEVAGYAPKMVDVEL
jgi:hypothetical protein